MSGRDHETDHDGECFPDCKECRILALEKEVRRLLKELRMAECYMLTEEEWEKKWGKDG
jgi:hypothetical protein